jgi:vacuolar protein-sorting-associated protein 4
VGKPFSAWSGVLMYGPPGTGKTFLAKALATEAKATFIAVSCGDIFTKWVGDSEKVVKGLFKLARMGNGEKQSIIFIDEIDAVAGGGGSNDSSNEVSKRVVNELLVQMDGIQSGRSAENEARVVVIGGTNRPWELHEGILRRFQRRIYISLPDRQSRFRIMRRLLDEYAKTQAVVKITNEDLMRVADQTEGYSSADMSTLIQSARMRLSGKITSATHFRQMGERWVPCSPGDPDAKELAWKDIPEKVWVPPLGASDLLAALQETRPSVRPETLPQYEAFTAKCGLSG